MLFRSGSIFGRTAEDAARAADRLKASADKILDPWRQTENAKFDVLRGTEEQLDQRLERMRQQFSLAREEMLFYQRSVAEANRVGNAAEAESFTKLAEDAARNANAISAQGKALASLRPQVRENELANKQQKDDEKRVQEMEEFRKSSEEAVAKFRQQSMERFGTEQQRMEARHARERLEAEQKFGNAPGEEENAAILKAQQELQDLQQNSGAYGALSLLKSQQEAERKKLEISEMEKKIDRKSTRLNSSH